MNSDDPPSPRRRLTIPDMVEDSLDAPSLLRVYEDLDFLHPKAAVYGDEIYEEFEQENYDHHSKWLNLPENRFFLERHVMGDEDVSYSEPVAEIELKDESEGLMEDGEGKRGSLEDDEGKRGLMEDEEENKVSMKDEEGKKEVIDDEEGKGVMEDKSATIEETVKVNNGSKASIADRVLETRTFLENIRQKSECRLKFLEEVPTPSNIDVKADSGRLKME